MRFSASTTLALAAAASAQTFTDCDPTKKSCPNDVGLPANSFSSSFKQDGAKANASWSNAAYSTITYGPNGAEFSIANEKQAPTTETDFAIFFGRIDVKMKASKGQGIVSSIVLQSADLDEIDWEFLGGDNANVQSNFFGKGNTTSYDRMQKIPVTTPSDTFHTYSVDWTAERLQFLLDGNVVRTIPYDDALTNYGKNYPQTPSKLKLGSWCGGCAKEEGTVQWAGGKPTFGSDPFVMYVESVTIRNDNGADAYEWSDRSGSWESIKLIKDGSASQPNGGANGGASPTGSNTVAPSSSHSVVQISERPTGTQTAHPGQSTNGAGSGSGSGSDSGSNAGSEDGATGSGPSNGGHGGADSTEDCETMTGDHSTHTVGTGGSSGSTLTSMTVVGPTAQVPYPTGTGSGAPGVSSNGTVTSPTPSGPVQQTGNAASSLTVASGSLFGVVFGLLFL